VARWSSVSDFVRRNEGGLCGASAQTNQ